MRRVLALLAGGTILVLITVVTVGGALAAPIGMWIAAIARRAGGRGYTRKAGWIGAVLACTILTAGFLGFALLRLPANFMDSVQQQTALRRQREPSAIEQAAERISAASSTPVVVQKSRELADSRPFMVWTMIMGSLMAAGTAGLLVGSSWWVGAALLMFGVRGSWQRRPAESGAPATQ